VEEILGTDSVTGARITNLQTGEKSELKAGGVFIAIGYNPNTGIFKGILKLDEQGYLVTRDEVLTDIEGVFIAGDVSDRMYRQAATAAGSGVKAALHVRAYLAELPSQEP
jgi:thioredoxin reductase (NADPH)